MQHIANNTKLRKLEKRKKQTKCYFSNYTKKLMVKTQGTKAKHNLSTLFLPQTVFFRSQNFQYAYATEEDSDSRSIGRTWLWRRRLNYRQL